MPLTVILVNTNANEQLALFAKYRCAKTPVINRSMRGLYVRTAGETSQLTNAGLLTNMQKNVSRTSGALIARREFQQNNSTPQQIPTKTVAYLTAGYAKDSTRPMSTAM